MTKTPVRVMSKQFENSIQILANITDTCNLDCFYCYNKKPRKNKKIDLNILYKLIIHIYKLTNKKIFLHLLGGEPTTHDQIKIFCRNISFYLLQKSLFILIFIASFSFLGN